MKKIALSCGDPSGVGPEVIESSLAKHPDWAESLCLIGPSAWLDPLCEAYSVEGLSVGSSTFVPTPGTPSERGAEIALEAMTEAANGCRNDQFSAVVTGPVSKYWLKKVGFSHPGQTEFFADVWGGIPTMAFVGKRLKVALTTWHIPLAQVPHALTKSCLELTVTRAAWLAQACGSPQPRIGVCGLNPHAGEQGIMGREEVDIIDPLLEALRQKYKGLSRCEPADTIFYKMLQGSFDIVVALYHDQGLAPLKTLEFDQAVNLSLGLPWLRTSPDHGTGFDIAGKGKAQSSSMEQAILLAQQLGPNMS